MGRRESDWLPAIRAALRPRADSFDQLVADYMARDLNTLAAPVTTSGVIGLDAVGRQEPLVPQPRPAFNEA